MRSGRAEAYGGRAAPYGPRTLNGEGRPQASSRGSDRSVLSRPSALPRSVHRRMRCGHPTRSARLVPRALCWVRIMYLGACSHDELPLRERQYLHGSPLCPECAHRLEPLGEVAYPILRPIRPRSLQHPGLTAAVCGSTYDGPVPLHALF